MLALKIIGLFFLVLFILSLFSIRVVPTYKDEVLTVKVYYLFFRAKVYPDDDDEKENEKKRLKKEKRQKKKAEKEARAKAKLVKKKEKEFKQASKKASSVEDTTVTSSLPASVKQTAKKESVGTKEQPKAKKGGDKPSLEQLKETLGAVWQLLQSSKKALLLLKKHLIIDKIFVDISVGGEDAHQTAVAFGHHCTAVTNALGWVGSYFNVRLKEIKLEPNFISEQSEYNASAVIRIRIIWIFIIVIMLLLILLKQKSILEKLMKKGGHKNESAVSN